MSDPFPAIAESAATGEIAALFADIRATVGVRVVNLVWRHLATLDGALPWAWQAVKPLYLHGMADRAVVGFRREMILPALGSLAGLEPPSVDAVLASYDHSNTVNLFALGALAAWLRGDMVAEGTPEQGQRLLRADVDLPPLASEADVPPETWQRVLRLNRFGDRPDPLILASMYRHLAHAPAFLQRLEAALTPVQAGGSLDRAILENRRAAHQRARVLARAISAEQPLAERIEASLSAFVEHAIGKMVTICRAIRWHEASCHPERGNGGNMLLGLDPVLGPDLLHALAAMGHGDRIALVDADYPATRGRRLIHLPGLSTPRVLQAVLSVFPIDTFTSDPCAVMQVVGEAGAVPAVVTEMNAALARHGAKPAVGLERNAFYAAAESAYAIVQTGERRFYGNILLTKGVVAPEETV